MDDPRDIRVSSEILSDLLEAIPKWDNGAITIDDWIERANAGKDCLNSLLLIISLLDSFDVISIYRLGDKPNIKIKSRSETAHYFIKSFAKYLRENKKILSNWERPGVTQGPFGIQDFVLGPQFLYAMEFQRSLDNENTSTIRESAVVKLIIKAHVRGKKEPLYLVQFDNRSKKYQLIGGHIRNTDKDHTSAIRREIEEEIHRGNFTDGFDYDLQFLDKVIIKELSSTYSAYTEYILNYFQIFI